MIEIRELCAEDDYEAVGSVYVKSWQTAYRGIVPQRYLDKLTHDRWGTVLRAEPSASLGMFLDGQVIGTSSVSADRDGEREGYGEIVSIYLLPQYVGQGHGRALMQATLAKLGQEGYTDVCLWALTQNVRARGFYEHMGFARTGRVQREQIGGEPLEVSEYLLRGL